MNRGLAKQLNPNPNPYNDSHLTLNTTIVAVIMSSAELLCVRVCIWIARKCRKKLNSCNSISSSTYTNIKMSFIYIFVVEREKFIDTYTTMMCVCVCVCRFVCLHIIAWLWQLLLLLLHRCLSMASMLNFKYTHGKICRWRAKESQTKVWIVAKYCRIE